MAAKNIDFKIISTLYCLFYSFIHLIVAYLLYIHSVSFNILWNLSKYYSMFGTLKPSVVDK